jgi:hypothetical protein
MGPDVWGPHAWKFLHYVSLSYPNNPTREEKAKYKQFFELLSVVLPCSICANHYAENYKKMPLTDEILSDKEKVIKWVIDVHNVVNEMKGKPIIRYRDARVMIETDTKCVQAETFVDVTTPKHIHKKSSDNSLIKLLGILFGLIVIAIVYKKK